MRLPPACCKQTQVLPSGPQVPGSLAQVVRVTTGQMMPWHVPLTQVCPELQWFALLQVPPPVHRPPMQA